LFRRRMSWLLISVNIQIMSKRRGDGKLSRVMRMRAGAKKGAFHSRERMNIVAYGVSSGLVRARGS